MKHFPQEDAEFLAELHEYLNSASTAGTSQSITKLFLNIEEQFQQEFNRLFGPESPWSFDWRKKNVVDRVYWDSEKANRLQTEEQLANPIKFQEEKEKRQH
jgi:hypothetical protein